MINFNTLQIPSVAGALLLKLRKMDGHDKSFNHCLYQTLVVTRKTRGLGDNEEMSNLVNSITIEDSEVVDLRDWLIRKRDQLNNEGQKQGVLNELDYRVRLFNIEIARRKYITAGKELEELLKATGGPKKFNN